MDRISTTDISTTDNDRLDDRLDELYHQIETEYKTFIGYPCSGEMDYEPLFRFLRFPINNVGDPFVPSSYRVNTKQIECEVLDLVCRLASCPA